MRFQGLFRLRCLRPLASAAAQLSPAQDAVGQRKALGESTANEKAFQTAREDATNDNAFGDSPRPRDRSRQARPACTPKSANFTVSCVVRACNILYLPVWRWIGLS